MEHTNPTYDLKSATWRKSSYSGGSGADCLEVAATWRKSSRSGGEGGNCLEVAAGHPGVVPVRDSKNPGPTLAFREATWSTFVAGVKNH